MDGKKINSKMNHFRNNIGYVPQEIYLSDASIYENITLNILVKQIKIILIISKMN